MPLTSESLYVFVVPLCRSHHNQFFTLEVVVVEKVISELKSWLPQRSAEWYREDIQALTSEMYQSKRIVHNMLDHLSEVEEI
jgi:hypothetical protein